MQHMVDAWNTMLLSQLEDHQAGTKRSLQASTCGIDDKLGLILGILGQRVPVNQRLGALGEKLQTQRIEREATHSTISRIDCALRKHRNSTEEELEIQQQALALQLVLLSGIYKLSKISRPRNQLKVLAAKIVQRRWMMHVFRSRARRVSSLGVLHVHHHSGRALITQLLPNNALKSCAAAIVQRSWRSLWVTSLRVIKRVSGKDGRAGGGEGEKRRERRGGKSVLTNHNNS